jgi:hypothetical protein
MKYDSKPITSEKACQYPDFGVYFGRKTFLEKLAAREKIRARTKAVPPLFNK